KMDFLGLKTLTLIKHAVRNVKDRFGIELDPDNFPIDDEKTYELFQRGETVGIFQYESAGMQKYMRELKPTVFADLIAMNALYRPGPIEYIPSFIKRKNGEEAITYDLDASEEYLKETYGITVYQEQVMLLSQKLANFTKGEADVLRKAMGKKQKDVLDKMKPKFIEQASKMNGHDVEKLEKIWKDWEAFASYAFNKSHSTCYAWIAYQTAYLKANYPAEYMASVLSNNMNNIADVSMFMEECKRMGLDVLGPDVNESSYDFTVNKAGQIRFGLGAIKGLGAAPVESIINERSENGNYTSIFDFVRRANLRLCNKRAMENLAYGGGFDSFKEISRSQFFKEDTSGKNFIETLSRYGNAFQENENSSQHSLFGEGSAVSMPEPIIPKGDDWPSLYKLNKEKEVIGIFISGHPLDDYRLEIDSFCNGKVSMLGKPEEHLGKEVLVAGIITECSERMSKNNTTYGILTIEDYEESFGLFLFGDNYQSFKPYFFPNTFVAIKGKFEMHPKFRKPEFKIYSITRLQDLKDKMAHDLQIRIPNKQLDQLIISDLNSLFVQYPGNCNLTFQVYDAFDENLAINMTSRNIRINPTKEVVSKLKEMDLEFTLKTK
ncbi:MAG TPA: DNA polymerase III subunit alpha, partial [Crocinitomicaceae bacterium]|nr:DNA polymerase III subunit alpha [Crocinitomicaceae bacterium]